jgi:hypothetical protein
MLGRKSLFAASLLTALLGGTLIGHGEAGANPPVRNVTLVTSSSSPHGADASPDPALRHSEPDDISVLLPLLLNSDDRQRFVAELELSLRQGKMDLAEHQVNSAIDIGTLAIVLADKLRNPNLLAALQEQGIRGDGRKAPPQTIQHDASVPDACSSIGRPSPVDVSELQTALQDQKAKNRSITEELAALKVDFTSLQAFRKQEEASAASGRSDLQKALEQEQARNDAIMQELARTKEELRNAQLSRDVQANASLLANTSLLGFSLVGPQTETGFSSQGTQMTLPATMVAALSGRDTMPLNMEPLPALSDPAPVVSAPTQPSGPAEKDQVRTASTSPTPIPITSPTTMTASISAAGKPIKSGTALASKLADDRLLARADVLLRSGDVSAARLLLERSLEAGNGRAAYLLAQTFDPDMLSKLGVLGIAGDAAKAQEYYTRARSLGVSEADERIRMQR